MERIPRNGKSHIEPLNRNSRERVAQASSPASASTVSVLDRVSNRSSRGFMEKRRLKNEKRTTAFEFYKISPLSSSLPTRSSRGERAAYR